MARFLLLLSLLPFFAHACTTVSVDTADGSTVIGRVSVPPLLNSQLTTLAVEETVQERIVSGAKERRFCAPRTAWARLQLCLLFVCRTAEPALYLAIIRPPTDTAHRQWNSAAWISFRAGPS